MNWKMMEKMLAVFAVATLATAGTLIVGTGQKASASPKASGPRAGAFFNGGVLVGVWQVKVQLYNCATKSSLGAPFSSLLTFNDGGTMTGSTINPGFAAGQRGPDHGVWNYEGRRTYGAKSMAFIEFTTPAVPPVNPGFQAGTQTITQTIEFDDNPDQWTSDAAVEFFDSTGTSYRTACASATGTRFE